MPQRVADYFFIVTVDPEKTDLETGEPQTYISYRYPKEDYPDEVDAFPEAADYFCLPGGFDIAYKDLESRKPFISTRVFTDAHGTRKYCTILKFYEDLYIDSHRKYNMFNQPLYKPISFCLISSQPFFSITTAFLKELYDHTVKPFGNNTQVLQNLFSRSPVSPEEPSNSLSPNTKRPETPSQKLNDLKNLRRSSFDDALRRKTTFPECSIQNIPLLPFEYYVQWFIDFLPLVEGNLCYHIPIYNNVYTLSIPPLNSLPYIDPIAFRLLFNCLSSANILTILQAILLDQYIVIHSTKLDTLTLCLDALIALIYPYRSYSNLFSLVRGYQTGYVNCPVPTICGMDSDTFATMDDTDFYGYTYIVHLDFNQITSPTQKILPSLPSPILSSFKHFFKHSLPPPSVRLLYHTNSISSYSFSSPFPSNEFLVFEIVLSLYNKGLFLESARKKLIRNGPEKQCVLLKANFHDDSNTFLYHYESNPLLVYLLKNNPILLSINNISVISRPVNKVASLFISSPNPTVLRLQLGESPIDQRILSDQMNSSTSFYQNYDLDLEDNEDFEDPSSLYIDSSSATNETPVDSSNTKDLVHRYHYFTSSNTKNTTNQTPDLYVFPSEDIFMKNYQHERDLYNQFIEEFRIRVLKMICELLVDYDQYINYEDDDNHLHPFFTKEFIESKPASLRPFLTLFTTTQVFTTLVSHTRDYKQSKEVDSNITFLMTVLEILKKDPKHSLDILFYKLSSSNSHIQHFYVPAATNDEISEDLLNMAPIHFDQGLSEKIENSLSQPLNRCELPKELCNSQWTFDSQFDLKVIPIHESDSESGTDQEQDQEQEQKQGTESKVESKPESKPEPEPEPEPENLIIPSVIRESQVLSPLKECKEEEEESTKETTKESTKESNVYLESKKKTKDSNSSSYTYSSGSYSYYSDSYTYTYDSSYYDSDTESSTEPKKQKSKENKSSAPVSQPINSTITPTSEGNEILIIEDSTQEPKNEPITKLNTSQRRRLDLPALESVSTVTSALNHLSSIPPMTSLPKPILTHSNKKSQSSILSTSSDPPTKTNNQSSKHVDESNPSTTNVTIHSLHHHLSHRSSRRSNHHTSFTASFEGTDTSTPTNSDSFVRLQKKHSNRKRKSRAMKNDSQ